MINIDELINLRSQGLGYASIGRELGVSRQAIEQRIKILTTDHPELKFNTKGHRNGLKKCTICKQFLSLTEFHRNKASWDGLSSRCKSCNTLVMGRYYKNHPDAIKQIARKYVKANPDKARAWGRAHQKYPNRQVCEIDGCNKLGVRHHDNYEKDIIRFLCPLHHKQFHLQKEAACEQ